ncbi:MAG: M23 family metallopeptidase [Acidobacteriota bacterium]
MRFVQVIKRVLLITLFIIGLIFAIWLAFIARPSSEFIGRATAAPANGQASKPVKAMLVGAAEEKPANVETVSAAPTLPSPPAVVKPAVIGGANSTKLTIPVQGITPDKLTDTFDAARSEGRTHQALDIMAPRGTPVIAAAGGVIKRIFYSERGGHTLYQLGIDGKTVFYYAHLDSYAKSIAQGSEVKQGEVLAYVGDTGNAGAGNYHLHFAMWMVTDPKRLWSGENINPYPLLR